MDYKDYYKVLGVEKAAAADEIKKVYRKLAVKYHPDKNQGDKKAEERFKEITEAYDVLGDAEKRKKYDEMGANWQQYQHAGTQYGGGRPQGGGFQDYGDMFGNEGHFSDFFESFFGSGSSFGSGGKRTRRQRKGEDHQAETTISLEEAFHGTSRQVNLGDQKLSLKLKPGIAEGQVLRMQGKGGKGANGAADGDLFITVHVAPHSHYERRGDDLHFEQPLDVFTAMLGGKVTVQAMDKSLSITIPAGTDSGKVFRLKGMGMPKYADANLRGDAYVKLNITVPKNLTDGEKEALSKIAAAHR